MYDACVNDAGQVAGWRRLPRSDGTFVDRAFVRTSGGGLVDLGAIPGGNGTSYSGRINNRGYVAGISTSPLVGLGYPFHAFLWKPKGGLLDLGVLPSSLVAPNSFAFRDRQVITD